MSNKHDPKSSALHHFWAGAVPAAAAVLMILVQILQPYAAHEQQGIVLTIADWLISIALAVWVWCVVHDVAGRFETRDEDADERQRRILEQAAENHAEVLARMGRLANAVQAVHGRIETVEKRLAVLEQRYPKDVEQRLAAAEERAGETDQEMEHLRKLVLQGSGLAAMATERLGPRPVG